MILNTSEKPPSDFSLFLTDRDVTFRSFPNNKGDVLFIPKDTPLVIIRKDVFYTGRHLAIELVNFKQFYVWKGFIKAGWISEK